MKRPEVRKPREWFCIIEEESEDGSSSIYGTTEDPTGANLAWEKPFKVHEVIPEREEAIGKMVKALESVEKYLFPVLEHNKIFTEALEAWRKATGSEPERK